GRPVFAPERPAHPGLRCRPGPEPGCHAWLVASRAAGPHRARRAPAPVLLQAPGLCAPTTREPAPAAVRPGPPPCRTSATAHQRRPEPACSCRNAARAAANHDKLAPTDAAGFACEPLPVPC